MAAVTPASRPARPGRWPVVLAWALWALAILGVGLVVLGLGQLLGQGSSLVVAAATLTVAAAFQPLRRASGARSTGASTGAATTPPRRSRRSAPGSGSRSTWTRSRPSC
jgi:hypothetical protein